VGAYRKGNDPRIDEAVALRPAMLDFLRQNSTQPVNLELSLGALGTLLQNNGVPEENGT
jgi:flagellum-specific ATP synthase